MENKSARRDLGHNNVVKRPHLNIAETNIYEIFNEEKVVDKLQKVVDKIEHRLNRCEDFLIANKEEVSLSYYTEGYYNGRAGAFEDMLDCIEEILNE